MGQDDIHKAWLSKSAATRGARAEAHARKAVAVLIKLHRANLFKDRKKITLLTLTEKLAEAGVKSATGGSLVSMMVARMFIHVNMTWQDFVMWMTEDSAARAIQTRDSYEYTDSKDSNIRSASEQVKIDRHLESVRLDALGYNCSLTDGNGRRIGVKEYFRRMRIKEPDAFPVRVDFVRLASDERSIRARLADFDFTVPVGALTFQQAYAAVEAIKMSALRAKIAAMKAEISAIRSAITARQNKTTNPEPMFHRKSVDPKQYRLRRLRGVATV